MSKFLLAKCIILFWFVSSAQVQVRDEPRHHNVFENDYIRILDVFLAPDDTTQYHLHNTPSVFIILANCKVSSQLTGGQPQPGANVAGDISYDPMTTDRAHRVWNEDTIWFHVLDVELTAKTQKSRTTLLQNPSLKLLFNEQQVNGYMIELLPEKNLELPPSANGYLLVSLDNSFINITISKIKQHRSVKPGHYEWIEQGRHVALSNNSGSGGKFVLLQLK